MILEAYAKINWSLDITGVREDGYHYMDMLMQPVSLADEITLTPAPSLGISTSGWPHSRADESNLAYRAAKALKEASGYSAGASVHVHKRIPVGAGMGGGSADAAAVLIGLNRLWNTGLSAAELERIGLTLGADVPFCLTRGTALSEGIGEVLTPLKKLPVCPIVLAKPAVSVSTKFVYQNLHVNDLPAEAHPDVDSVITALEKQDVNEVAVNMGNILETVTCKKYPEIELIKDAIKELGAVNAIMSGSGPTVFGIFSDVAEAKKCYEALRFGKYRNLAKQVYLTEPWR
jgi:4-diphosphocytidyl-2-C-methyl-D-erythritol kinase